MSRTKPCTAAGDKSAYRGVGERVGGTTARSQIIRAEGYRPRVVPLRTGLAPRVLSRRLRAMRDVTTSLAVSRPLRLSI